MRKRTIQIIIIFSSVSLIGLILTQTFWVKNALDLAERQHAHRVDLALDDVIEELMDRKDTILADTANSNIENKIDENIFTVLDTFFLEQLIDKYVDYHELDSNFYYYIVKTSNDSVIYPNKIKPFIKNEYKIHKACLYCLWKKDYYHLELYFPDIRKHELTRMSLWLVVSGIFLTIIIISFYYIIVLIFKQKKISQIRDDFINNITHEFKTPISTISLASEVLLNHQKDNPSGRIAKYSRVIYDENRRMRSQIDRVLQMAVLDKGEYVIQKTEIDMNEFIRNNVNNLCLEHCENEIDIQYNLNAEKSVLKADEMHMANILNNLVTNALKYSGKNPKLKIGSKNEKNDYIFWIEDNGVGIRKEDQKHIFDKFYRVHTGNIHDVKGFGLGLYYVKTMIEAHRGEIFVQSEPGKGTRFVIKLPGNNP